MVNKANSFKMISSVMAVLMMGLSQVHGQFFDDFLESMEKEFDSTSIRSKQYEIVSQPLNSEYLCKLSKEEKPLLNEEKLRAKVSRDPLVYEDKKSGKSKINCDKTNLFQIAISRGNSRLVGKFLECVDKVNDPELTAWGYRQPYTLAHMVLDPQYSKVSQDVSLEERLMIIDLMGENGADFNAVIRHDYIGIYSNPPLAAGEPSGHPVGGWEGIMNKVRARALLYGADPSVTGSSFNGITQYHSPKTFSELLNLTFDYYVERLKVGAKLSPTAAVKKELDKLAQIRGINFDTLLPPPQEKGIDANPLARFQAIEKQLQKNETQIKMVKDQKTKKAKLKLRYLELVKSELQKEKDITGRKITKSSTNS